MSELHAVSDVEPSQVPVTVAGLRVQALGIKLRNLDAAGGISWWLDELASTGRGARERKAAAVALRDEVFGSGDVGLVGHWAQMLLDHYGLTVPPDDGVWGEYVRALEVLEALESPPQGAV